MMRTFTHIKQFEDFISKNILGKKFQATSIGDQAVGHTLEKNIFGEVMGRGVKDLIVMKDYFPPRGGWDYELKAFTYIDNKLHILRQKKITLLKGEKTWQEVAYDKMRRCYIFSAEKVDNIITYKKCWKLSGLIKKKFFDCVASRYSYTHNATEVYLKKPTDVNYIYKNRKEVNEFVN